MGCRTTPAHKLGAGLGFKQYDVINEQKNNYC